MVDTLGKVELIRRIAERLESYLSSLPQDNWSQPSRCDGWQLADVVAHLTGERNARPRVWSVDGKEGRSRRRGFRRRTRSPCPRAMPNGTSPFAGALPIAC